MNVQWVKEKISEIKKVRRDPEAAHCLEDSLHEDVLEAIAAGSCDDPVGCAKEALMTRDISFPRWCA